MKTIKTIIYSSGRSFTAAVCAGAVLIIAFSAPAQNLFVAELQSGTITEITPSGVESTFAIGLNHPASLAFNSAGNLYEADYGSGNVFQFTTNGVQSSFASLSDPFVLAFDSSSNLFVANTVNSTITKITPGGVQSLFASGLNGPSSLAFDRAGNLFVGNFSGTIIKITPSGVTNTFATGFNPRDGLALAFNSMGILFVGEIDNNTSYGSITEITPGGVQSNFLAYLPFSCEGLAFNNVGNLFVADYDDGNIIEITPNGTTSTFASGLGSGNPLALAFQGETLPVPPPPANISIQKAVYLISTNLQFGADYQLQASSDLINWTNQGSVFTATNSYWQSTNYWNVNNWNQLFFRLQDAP
jgi:hypothetical protein